MKKNYLSSTKLYNANIITGFFTRKNGLSKNNFKSLNCSYSSGDTNDNVAKNIVIAKEKINLSKTNTKILNQIHSNKVIFINKLNYDKSYKADGIITTDKNISLAILTDDCCPIFIFYKDCSFICCLHAGWKGCYSNIISKAFKKIEKIQSNKNNINVIIGPCLSKENFEVEEDFKKKFVKKDKINESFFLDTSNTTIKNKKLFDMRAMIKHQIVDIGIKNVEDVDLDTYSNKELFFSHRRSTHLGNLPTGRMINIIGFNN